MRIEIAKNKVFLKFPKKKLEIHPIWLRERARLDKLHDKNTDQRLYDPSELNINLKIKKASISNGHLNVNFNDGINFDYDIPLTMLIEIPILNIDSTKVGKDVFTDSTLETLIGFLATVAATANDIATL